MGTTVSLPSTVLSSCRSEERLIKDGLIQKYLLTEERHGVCFINLKIPEGWKAFDISRENGIITWCITDENLIRRWLFSGKLKNETKNFYLYNIGYEKKLLTLEREISKAEYTKVLDLFF